VASDSTVWRLLDQLGEPERTAVAAAPAAAWEVVWRSTPVSRCRGAGGEAAGSTFPGHGVGTEFSVGWAVTGRE
jgi:hypothetical protein